MSIFKRKNISEKSIAYEEAKKRVMELHNNAVFLMYINNVYIENASEQIIEGIVAIGKAEVDKEFSIYSCEGKYVTKVTIEEVYKDGDIVKVLEAEDREIKIYLKDIDDKLIAGQIMIIL